MNEIELIDFCEEHFTDYAVCKALECEELCKDGDCPLVRVFSGYRTALREKADFVRCKYCEYWQDNNGGYPHEECRWGHDETPDADDFCSYGKRLEVEQG